MATRDVAKGSANEPKEYKRIHFRFPPQAVEQLEELKQDIGAASYVEVLKIALGLLHWAVGHLRQGGTIEAVYDGEPKERIVLPGVHPRRG